MKTTPDAAQSLCVLVFLVASILPAVANAATAINTCDGLQALGSSGDYILTSDINCSATSSWNSGAGFVPIPSFTGTLDGQGHVITGLTINNGSSAGLIVNLDAPAVIQNLTIEVNITSAGYTGGIAAVSSSGTTISNVGVTGTINADYQEVGGIVGKSSGPILQSWTNVAMTGGTYVGGIAGTNHSSSSITDCYARGPVTGSSNSGGLVGLNYGGSITRSYATGAVSGSTGGLVGWNYDGGSIANSYWDEQSSGTSNMCIQESSVGCDNTKGRTTTEMKTQSTFVGWDFSNVWQINPAINDGYPSFQYQVATPGPTSSPTPVPTLGVWNLIGLAGMLAALVTLMKRV